MEVLLIRHGESHADLLDVHEGRADFELTSLGIEQAERLGEWVISNFPLEQIWTSPLRRAKHTAEILAARLEVPVLSHDGLMEWDNGVLAGLKRDEAKTLYPELVGGRKPHESVPSGESELQFRCRVEVALSEIISQSSSYNRIAVVSHGGTISKLLSAFLRLPVVNEYRFETGNTGCHLLSLNDTGRSIRFMNRQDHLDSAHDQGV